MFYFNYDSYFRFVAFSRVSYLNKYVVFNYVSLLKITFRLNIVLVMFVLNIVRVNLSCVILFLSFYFIFLLIGPDQGSCKLTQFSRFASHHARPNNGSHAQRPAGLALLLQAT